MEAGKEVAKMTEVLPVYFPSELKRMIADRADALGTSMNDIVVRACAKVLAPNRPDLAIVPKKRRGRPRSVPSAAPVTS